MDIKKILEEILNYGPNWVVKRFVKNADTLEVSVYIEYVNDKAVFKEDSEELSFEIYDLCPERRWQHLNMFEYTTYIYCRIPRYKKKEIITKKLLLFFGD